MKVVHAAPILLAAVIAAPAAAEDCRYTAPREANVEADGAKRVRIDAAAGSLRVEAGTADSVRVRGTACTSKEKLLDDIRLEADRSGSTIDVRVEMPTGVSSWFGSTSMRLDLVVEVPDTLEVDIEDTSGEIQVSGVKALKLDDGSGEIVIDGVSGRVEVEDGSGSIEISRAGDVRVRDGSGSIRIHGVEGDVDIVEDGSGEIDIRGVQGSVDIVEDGSGSIEVEGATGNVFVGRDGSGSIEVRDIGGSFTVERDGSGSISHRNVEGEVSIPKGK